MVTLITMMEIQVVMTLLLIFGNLITTIKQMEHVIVLMLSTLGTEYQLVFMQVWHATDMGIALHPVGALSMPH